MKEMLNKSSKKRKRKKNGYEINYINIILTDNLVFDPDL